MIVVKISGCLLLLLAPVLLMGRMVLEETGVNAPMVAPVVASPCGNASRQELSGALASGGDHVPKAGESFGGAPACKVDLEQARQDGLPLFPDAALR